MRKKTHSKFVLFLFSTGIFLFISVSCVNSSHESFEKSPMQQTNETAWCIEGIDELKTGDILVRPNLSLLPGSAAVKDGTNFGHAALVIKGYKHAHPDSLLAGAVIVESIAKDVSKEFQVREIHALAHHKLVAFRNVTFDSSKKGSRYRLRLQLSDDQIDAIVAFALQQKGDYSSWNAAKRMMSTSKGDELSTAWADNSHWYCSLLVWQSVMAVTGIDLDPNKGYMVYPNDLIQAPQFFNAGSHVGRARF
jgi:hypothetical protein